MPKGSFYQSTKLPPKEAIAYFKAKGNQITWDWREQLVINNAQTFTVAKVMKMDVLQDFRDAIDKALGEGITFKEFKEELKPRLSKKGWWPKEQRAPDGKMITMGAAQRLKVIYRTNTQSSYMAGRWNSFQANKEFTPYMRYIAVVDGETTEICIEYNGKIYHIDDPIWSIIMPPNHYGCRSRTEPLTAEEAQALGIETMPPDVEPQEGFKNNPGKDRFEPVQSDYDADIWRIANAE